MKPPYKTPAFPPPTTTPTGPIPSSHLSNIAGDHPPPPPPPLNSLNVSKSNGNWPNPGSRVDAGGPCHGPIRVHDGDRGPGTLPELHYRQFFDPILLMLLSASQRREVPASVPLHAAQWWCVVARHHHQSDPGPGPPWGLQRPNATC